MQVLRDGFLVNVVGIDEHLTDLPAMFGPICFGLVLFGGAPERRQRCVKSLHEKYLWRKESGGVA